MCARLPLDVIPCKVGSTGAAQLISPGCGLGARKGTESRTRGGFAVSDLSLCSGLLAAESMAGSSDGVGYIARTQQEKQSQGVNTVLTGKEDEGERAVPLKELSQQRLRW